MLPCRANIAIGLNNSSAGFVIDLYIKQTRIFLPEAKFILDKFCVRDIKAVVLKKITYFSINSPL